MNDRLRGRTTAAPFPHRQRPRHAVCRSPRIAAQAGWFAVWASAPDLLPGADQEGSR